MDTFLLCVGIAILILVAAISTAILIVAISWARRITTVIEVEETSDEGHSVQPEAVIAQGLSAQLAELRSSRFAPQSQMGVETYVPQRRRFDQQ